jgi:hypothetical protein
MPGPGPRTDTGPTTLTGALELFGSFGTFGMAVDYSCSSIKETPSSVSAQYAPGASRISNGLQNVNDRSTQSGLSFSFMIAAIGAESVEK